MSLGGGGLKWPKESDIKGEGGGGQKWPQKFGNHLWMFLIE